MELVHPYFRFYDYGYGLVRANEATGEAWILTGLYWVKIKDESPR